MRQRAVNGSGGNTGKFYYEEGKPISSEVTINCGFAPRIIVVTYHCPNFTNPIVTNVYNKDVIPDKQVQYGYTQQTPGYYAMNITTAAILIKALTSTGFNIGYNSVVGSCTYDVYAIA